MDPRIIQPKVGKHGRPVNPADLPALRIFQRYSRYIKRGRSETEAADLALREKGKCSRILPSGEICGAPAATPAGVTCAECKRKDTLGRARKQHERGYHSNHTKTCQVCGVEFQGYRDRVNCQAHTQVRVVERKDKGIPRGSYGKQSGKKRQEAATPRKKDLIVAPAAPEKILPPTWNIPLPESKKLAPKPTPVVVDAEMEVPFYPLKNWGRWEGGDAT